MARTGPKSAGTIAEDILGRRTRSAGPEPAGPALAGLGGTLAVKELLGKLELLVDAGYLDDPSEPMPPADAPHAAPADIDAFTGPVSIDGWESAGLRRLLAAMISIRAVERGLARLADDGHIAGPDALGIGQEAVPVGIARHLSARDRVFSAHRSRGHYLAMAGSIFDLFTAMLDRTGTGAAARLHAPEVGFCGSVAEAGTAISMAVGAAMSIQPEADRAVTVVYVGEEAPDDERAREALALAEAMKLPLVVVRESELEADRLGRNGAAPPVDGNDAVAVAGAAQALIARARAGGGPCRLEAVTCRWPGVFGPDAKDGAGAAAFEAWQRHDPVARLSEAMIRRGELTAEAATGIEMRARELVGNAIRRALGTPAGAPDAGLDTRHGRRRAG